MIAMCGFLLPALAVAASAQSPQLPPRFAIPDAAPAIRKNVQPAKFAESAGRRAAILGREDGQFEAWVMPVKVLRDFRLSVYFDGALEPLPLAEFAERIIAGPGRVTIVHSHAAFTIRQTWIASPDEPFAVVLLDIDTARPLRLRAAFQPEMKPMWPAGFGGQASSFDESEKAFVVSEGRRRHAAVIGSPAFTRFSEQIGHQMPDRTVLIEMDITPAEAQDHLIPIIIAASSTGAADARKLYRDALGRLPALVAKSDAWYRDFAQRTLRIETPDPVLNAAFDWAKYAVEKGWQCNEGVGCGLVAGFGPSGASERPGFGWYFGGDALMNSWSILDYGDAGRVRALLEFLLDKQRADGKIMHELTQSAALLDWSKYPYGYYHGDTTALFIYSIERHLHRTGDLDFIRKSWPAIEKAYHFYLPTLNPGGLVSNRKAGMAAVETGALSGKVDKDIYLQGTWLAALGAYGRMRAALGMQSGDTAERLQAVSKSLIDWFTGDYLAFGALAEGGRYNALSSWQSFALGHGGLNGVEASRSAAALNRPELSSDWGARLFATDSPSYDPLSYNDGSVWPFVTGFVTFAEYRHHFAEAGYQHLHGTAALSGLSGAGFIPEYMSGDRAQQLVRAVPHQLFSSSAVLQPLVSGMLGLDGDALHRMLVFAPHLPPDWPRVRFERYRTGNSIVSGEVERKPGVMRIALRIEGDPLAVKLAPSFPAGSDVESPGSRIERTGADVHAVSRLAAAHEITAEYRVQEGVAWLPQFRELEPGDRSRAPRLISTNVTPCRIEFLFAAPAGSPADLKYWAGQDWRTEAAPETFPAGTEYTHLRVTFSKVGKTHPDKKCF